MAAGRSGAPARSSVRPPAMLSPESSVQGSGRRVSRPVAISIRPRCQRPASVKQARMVAGAEKSIPAAAEGPGRAGEFGRHRTDGLLAIGVKAIEVPPAALVGHEIELPVGRPGRLHDRLAWAAGDPSGVAELGILADLGEPELGPVPGHVRVVPAEPGELPAVRAEAGRAEEVVAGGQLAAGVALLVEPDRDDTVDRFARGSVVFAHGEDASTAGIELEIGVTQPLVRGRRQRYRRARCRQAMEALVGEVDRDDHAVPDRIGAAAIFVDPRADVEGRRRQVGGRPVQGPSHQHGAAAFLRPDLEPPGDLAVEHWLRQSDLGGGDQTGRDRRSPTAIACNPWHAFRLLAGGRGQD